MKLTRLFSDARHFLMRPRSVRALQTSSYHLGCNDRHITDTVKIVTKHLLLLDSLDSLADVQATFNYYDAPTVEYTDLRMHPVAREIAQENEEKCIYTGSEAAPLSVVKGSQEIYVQYPATARVWSLKFSRSPKGWFLKIKLNNQIGSDKRSKQFIKYLSDLFRALNFTH